MVKTLALPGNVIVGHDLMATMYCDFCLQLFQDIAERRVKASRHYRWGRYLVGRSRLWTAQKKTTLKQTQLHCCLCRTVSRYIENSSLLGVPLVYTIITRESSIQLEHQLLSQCEIELDTEGQRSGGSHVTFALWADRDSPASAVFVPRPSSLTASLDDISGLVRYWLNVCLSSHKACSITDETQLPTRVLEISGELATPFIKLVETSGMQGRYCALSHCWGAPDKRPLLTTRENISEHLDRIRFESLPKTFREAVTLVHRIGISYLWIDSLCIIQNDKQDWHSEAKEMGTLYRNATLVIAAAGSKDSTEGLIFKERPQANIVTAPFFDNNLRKGSFNLSVLTQPYVYIDEHQTPLDTRAWAFQEWYLARRLLIFASSGFVWTCERLTMNEREINYDLRSYASHSWLWLLTEYSEKKLTYPSDRLYALQGIVAEMKKTRQDQYNQHYGVWENQLPSQLLWKMESCPERGSVELPTWTWAATEGSKQWMLLSVDLDTIDQSMLKGILITGKGSIKALGQMARFKHVLQWDFRMTDVIIRGSDGIILPYYEEQIFHTGIRPYLLAADDLSNESVMGIAVFDSYGEHVLHARCFFMVSTLREQYGESDVPMDSASSDTDEDLDTSESDNVSQVDADDTSPNLPGVGPFSMEVDGDHRVTVERSADADESPHHAKSKSGSSERSRHPYSPIHKSCRTSIEGKAINADNEEGKQKDEDDDNDDDDEDDEKDDDEDDDEDDHKDDEDYDEYDRHRANEVARLALATTHVYWALLLEPIGEGKYKRVGVAMMYPHAFEKSSKDLVEVEIV